MEKTMTLNLRVNPTVKQQAEDVLKQLGIPMATAIDMYLRQITLTGGIPFSLSLPKAPAALNADTMTDEQLHAALQMGIKEIQNGDTVGSRKPTAPTIPTSQSSGARPGAKSAKAGPIVWPSPMSLCAKSLPAASR